MPTETDTLNVEELTIAENGMADVLVNLDDELHLLKSLVVNDDNMPLILEKLNLTRSYREELVARPEVELKTYFPYFFTHPHLV